MDGDEAALPPGRGGAGEGLPPQSAKALCPNLLQPGQGHCAAGGSAGPQQHQHYTDLYYVDWNGASAEAGAHGAGGVAIPHNLHYVVDAGAPALQLSI